MIFDKLENLKKYADVHPRFAKELCPDFELIPFDKIGRE